MLLKNQESIAIRIAYSKKNRKEKFHQSIPKWNDNLLSIRSDTGIQVRPFEDVILCKSDSNYSIIYTAVGETIFLSKTLKHLEEKLPPDQFARVHQSYLVRLDSIREYTPSKSQLVLSNTMQVPVSRSRKRLINNLLIF